MVYDSGSQTGVRKNAARGTRNFKCLHNDILTSKYNKYRYISNCCAHDYSQGVLDRQDIARKVYH